MRIGTKSVLFGAHCFAIHPWFVALGWWKLYGFPWQPWLWVMFFVHDLGYLGKPNMDGPEGEEHPWLGARFLYWLQGAWLFVTRFWWRRDRRNTRPARWWQLRRRWAMARIAIVDERVIWGNESLFHSRFLAKRYAARPSRLCIADKLAIVLTPAWLYLPMAGATGEVREYMALALNSGKYRGEQKDLTSPARWYASMQDFVRRWVEEHRDGRADTWTGAAQPVHVDGADDSSRLVPGQVTL